MIDANRKKTLRESAKSMNFGDPGIWQEALAAHRRRLGIPVPDAPPPRPEPKDASAGVKETS